MVHNVSGYDLIDTLWNVKISADRNTGRYRQDLIDTLWNVKFDLVLKFLQYHDDLIDTLWNVKFNVQCYVESERARFNRYIVECKGEKDG